MIEREVVVTERAMSAPPDATRAESFARLADRGLASSYRLAAVLLGSEIEAQDAIQDAAVIAWERFSDLRDPARFDPWFQRILVNGCRDRLRRRSHVRLVPVETDADLDRASPDPTTAVAEREALLAALDALSADQRTVVVLRHFADLSVDEIADRTGERAGTVKSRLHYGLQALRAAYDAAGRLPEETSR